MTSPKAIVDWGTACGRTYLEVAGITVAVEGDPERDGTLGSGNAWTSEKIQAVVRRYEVAVSGLPCEPSPPPAGPTLGVLADGLKALAQAEDDLAQRRESLRDAIRDLEGNLLTRTCSPWRHERVPQLEALVAEAAARVAALRAQPGTP
jgi:hypothetical protein